MAAMIGVMIVAVVLMSLGSGHLPMMGGHHHSAGQTQESVTPGGDVKDCQKCPKGEKTEQADVKPAN